MTSSTTTLFDLSDHLAAKADPALIHADQQHLAAIVACLERSITEVSLRLDAVRRVPARHGQQALDRDLEVHRLSARLGTLRRYGADLCLGRMVAADGGEPIYVGRLGLADESGRRLLVDWRSPAAEPFFAATHAHPMGLASRRRYRWSGGRIRDYWDEAFTADGLRSAAALDDQSAFIASLGSDRSDRMRDVLGTIQADQDAIIRAGSSGALVVDGGPGTGKTVVALHRAAYLLYADPRLRGHRGGVLVVGPHEPYLAYVGDVLPSLGEDSVRLCTLRDLVPAGGIAPREYDEAVAGLKSSARLVECVEAAVRWYERPPSVELVVETPWVDVWVTASEWMAAFDVVEPGTPHNVARDQVWAELVRLLLEQVDEDGVPSLPAVRRMVQQDDELRAAFNRAWPVLDPVGVVADLWSVPAYLSLCAPWLTADEVQRLQRRDARAWTEADLPFLDAAWQRIGDPESVGRGRRRAAALAAERGEMDRVVDNLIEADDGEGLATMLRGADARTSLAGAGGMDERDRPAADSEAYAGPFAHVIVDEAQELTDAEWTMLLRRCPSRSFTIVGDRAQASRGFAESWRERLARVGMTQVELAPLTINYRTPEEVMAVAAPVIREVMPDANVPVSIRRGGLPVRFGSRSELSAILDRWLREHPDGSACVIGDRDFLPSGRVRSLSPELVKGLEFDLVVLVDPELFGAGGAWRSQSGSSTSSARPAASSVEGAVARYVAMTRATQELVVLTSP